MVFDFAIAIIVMNSVIQSAIRFHVHEQSMIVAFLNSHNSGNATVSIILNTHAHHMHFIVGINRCCGFLRITVATSGFVMMRILCFYFGLYFFFRLWRFFWFLLHFCLCWSWFWSWSCSFRFYFRFVGFVVCESFVGTLGAHCHTCAHCRASCHACYASTLTVTFFFSCLLSGSFIHLVLILLFIQNLCCFVIHNCRFFYD